MEVRSHSQVGPKVLSPAALVDEVAKQLRSAQPHWLRQLREQPDRFAELEGSVHHTFQQLADQLVAHAPLARARLLYDPHRTRADCRDSSEHRCFPGYNPGAGPSQYCCTGPESGGSRAADYDAERTGHQRTARLAQRAIDLEIRAVSSRRCL